jgi:hypothetical protein
MDEKKLSELMKDVVADTPPPTFTHADVTRESDRQRARRRNGLLTGSAFGVAVLAGAAALGVALWTGQGSPSQITSAESDAAGGNGTASPNELPDEGSGAAAPTERGDQRNFPPETPKQGGSPDGNGGPAGPTGTPSGCEQVDRELAAALAGELPAAANLTIDDAVPPALCLNDATGAEFYLPDGQISVYALPPDTAMTLDNADAGAAQASSTTHDGRLVVVMSVPLSPGETVPFESDLARYARNIARIL